MGSRKKPTGFSRTTGEEGSRGVSARERWVVAPKLTVSKFSPSTDGATEALEAERATKPAPLCGRPPGVMGCQGPAEAGGRGCPGGRHPPDGLWDPPRAGALTGGVVEVQGHLLAAHCHAGRVFLEYGWGVMLLMRGSGWFLGMWRCPGVQLDSSPPSTITPFSSAPPPSGSGIPKGDPQGSSRLSAIGTPETRGPGSGCRPRAVPCPQWSRARPPPPTRLQHPGGPHLGEGALAVHHEQRSLAASSVTHDHDLQLFPARARGGGRGRGLWDIHSREPATLAAVRGAEPRVERSQAGAGPRGRGQKNPRPP